MPITGRKPKPAGQAINRNKPTAEWVEVVNVPYEGESPDLPEMRTVMTQFGPKDFPVKQQTREWWKVVRAMPHCTLWAASDWAFALTTAMVADAAFSGTISAATELRNREKVLGTTVDYRRDLRIRYVDPQPETTGENVARLDDYRNL